MTLPRPKTENKTQAEVADMAPAQRDAYLQQKSQEGVDPGDGWLFGAVERYVAGAQAKQQSAQIGDKNVKDLTTGHDVTYVQGLHPSTTDYLGHEHAQLETFVGSNLDVEQVSKVSTAYHDVHKAFEGFATTMSTAVNQSKGQWEGEAAGAAQTYFGSLSKWADANSQNAQLASETIYDQGTAASNAKNQMPKPIPFAWNDEFKNWVTSNPLDLGDNIDKSIQKQKDSQAAHTEAAGVMKAYDKELYTAASKQPAFAEPPKFGAGGGGKIERIEKPGPNEGGNPPGTELPPGSSSLPGGGKTGSNGFVGNADNPNSSFLPPPASVSPPVSVPHGSTTGSGLLPVGNTTPSGFQNTGIPPAASNVGNSGMNNMGAMPMGGMGGMGPMGGGGEADYNSKVGRGGGGFGPGGGSGSGGASSSGASSGAARPGGVGAAEAAAGRGMGGLGGSAAGRGGAGMGGGMGGRGKTGEGEEDAEHQRPTYLVEGDPDEVFGTDMRTAPPVIGE